MRDCLTSLHCCLICFQAAVGQLDLFNKINLASPKGNMHNVCTVGALSTEIDLPKKTAHSVDEIQCILTAFGVNSHRAV